MIATVFKPFQLSVLNFLSKFPKNLHFSRLKISII